MFPERWLELAAGLAVVASTGVWVARGAARRRQLEILAVVWGLLWVGGSAASYWFLSRAVTGREAAPPEEQSARFARDLGMSLNLLTAARLALIGGFLLLVVGHLRRPPGGRRGTGPATRGDEDG